MVIQTQKDHQKAIADVIAAAPEDLDTLKEIADKLAGNDDLHTALNQAITERLMHLRLQMKLLELLVLKMICELLLTQS